jgi:hypothetical protein
MMGELKNIYIVRMVHGTIYSEVVFKLVTASLDGIEGPGWIKKFLLYYVPESGFYECLCIIIELARTK